MEINLKSWRFLFFFVNAFNLSPSMQPLKLILTWYPILTLKEEIEGNKIKGFRDPPSPPHYANGGWGMFKSDFADTSSTTPICSVHGDCKARLNNTSLFQYQYCNKIPM
jgi:hypothetical protein